MPEYLLENMKCYLIIDKVGDHLDFKNIGIVDCVANGYFNRNNDSLDVIIHCDSALFEIHFDICLMQKTLKFFAKHKSFLIIEVGGVVRLLDSKLCGKIYLQKNYFNSALSIMEDKEDNGVDLMSIIHGERWHFLMCDKKLIKLLSKFHKRLKVCK